jgi:hypothetical protein
MYDQLYDPQGELKIKDMKTGAEGSTIINEYCRQVSPNHVLRAWSEHWLSPFITLPSARREQGYEALLESLLNSRPETIKSKLATLMGRASSGIPQQIDYLDEPEEPPYPTQPYFSSSCGPREHMRHEGRSMTRVLLQNEIERELETPYTRPKAKIPKSVYDAPRTYDISACRPGTCVGTPERGCDIHPPTRYTIEVPKRLLAGHVRPRMNRLGQTITSCHHSNEEACDCLELLPEGAAGDTTVMGEDFNKKTRAKESSGKRRQRRKERKRPEEKKKATIAEEGPYDTDLLAAQYQSYADVLARNARIPERTGMAKHDIVRLTDERMALARVRSFRYE